LLLTLACADAVPSYKFPYCSASMRPHFIICELLVLTGFAAKLPNQES